MVNSKEITLIIIGLIVSFILSAFSIRFENFNFEIGDLIILIIISVISIVVIVYLKINELNKELNSQKIEQKKLREKLKIHEQLIDIKSELKELQKKVFKK